MSVKLLLFVWNYPGFNYFKNEITLLPTGLGWDRLLLLYSYMVYLVSKDN